MVGIPLTGPSCIYGDNKSQVTNSFQPESTLKKKCNSICYHVIRELVVMGESLIAHIKTDDNLSDFLTKTTSGAKRRKLVSGVVHDIYDNIPKQQGPTRQDQPTDSSHPTCLEGTEKI